ncbi:uncharacterized protein K441DRAFT_669399, partial [Cenococcum geophilum 1.58]
NVGTKYGTFKLLYSHIIMLEDRYTEVLQFDIIYIDILTGSNPKNFEDKLKIKTIELVDCKDVIKDTKFKRPYGRESLIRIVFRLIEWDYYGHIGTWEKTFHLISWTVREWLYNHIPLFILTSICFARYFLILWRAHR